VRPLASRSGLHGRHLPAAGEARAVARHDDLVAGDRPSAFVLGDQRRQAVGRQGAAADPTAPVEDLHDLRPGNGHRVRQAARVDEGRDLLRARQRLRLAGPGERGGEGDIEQQPAHEQRRGDTEHSDGHQSAAQADPFEAATPRRCKPIRLVASDDVAGRHRASR